MLCWICCFRLCSWKAKRIRPREKLPSHDRRVSGTRASSPRASRGISVGTGGSNTFRGCGSLPRSPPSQGWRVRGRKASAAAGVCRAAAARAILPWLTGLWGSSVRKWHTHAGTNKTLAISPCKSLAASRGKDCEVIWCLHYLHNMNQFVSKLLCGLIPDCRENQAGREDYYLQLV